MRILHTADWHLGITLNNYPRIDEQRFFAEQLIKTVSEEEIDAVIVAGDVFDSSVSNSEAITLYDEIMTELCVKMKKRVFVIAGNHDGAARLSQCGSLLSGSGLFVSGRLTNPIEPIIIDDCAFYLIPYFTVEEAKYLYPFREIKNYEQAMLAICDEIRNSIDKNKRNIAVSHAFISGAVLSGSDVSAGISSVGGVNMVSKEVFCGFDYTALGHLHGCQFLSPSVAYSGSPACYSVSEADNVKKFVIIDTRKDMEIRTREIQPMRSIRVLTGTFEELCSSAESSDDYVKIEITDRYAGIEALSTFREYYTRILSVTGKEYKEAQAENSLTFEEIEALKPDEMLEKFFAENYGVIPEKEDIQMFVDAMNERGDIQ